MNDWDTAIFVYTLGILIGILIGGASFLMKKKKRKALQIASIIIISFFSFLSIIWYVKTTKRTLRGSEYGFLISLLGRNDTDGIKHF